MNLFGQIREKVKEIPEGKVSTYGEVAKRLGIKDVRKIGWALHQNKDAEKCPCHRVVNKKGELAKGYVFGGAEVQRAVLQKEGVTFLTENTININKHLHIFS